jgi:hypothetical protein
MSNTFVSVNDVVLVDTIGRAENRLVFRRSDRRFGAIPRGNRSLPVNSGRSHSGKRRAEVDRKNGRIDP